MHEISERLAAIILKTLRGESTEAEKDELQRYIDASPKNREWFKRFNNDDWLATEIGKMANINAEESQKLLWERIEQYEKKNTGTK